MSVGWCVFIFLLQVGGRRICRVLLLWESSVKHVNSAHDIGGQGKITAVVSFAHSYTSLHTVNSPAVIPHLCIAQSYHARTQSYHTGAKTLLIINRTAPHHYNGSWCLLGLIVSHLILVCLDSLFYRISLKIFFAMLGFLMVSNYIFKWNYQFVAQKSILSMFVYFLSL